MVFSKFSRILLCQNGLGNLPQKCWKDKACHNGMKGSLVVGRWSADHLPTTFYGAACSIFPKWKLPFNSLEASDPLQYMYAQKHRFLSPYLHLQYDSTQIHLYTHPDILLSLSLKSCVPEIQVWRETLRSELVWLGGWQWKMKHNYDD